VWLNVFDQPSGASSRLLPSHVVILVEELIPCSVS
jgi:hypothetical protein